MGRGAVDVARGRGAAPPAAERVRQAAVVAVFSRRVVRDVRARGLGGRSDARGAAHSAARRRREDHGAEERRGLFRTGDECGDGPRDFGDGALVGERAHEDERRAHAREGRVLGRPAERDARDALYLAPIIYMQPPPQPAPPAPVEPSPQLPRDAISQLQCSVMDVYGLYTQALASLQNQSEELLHHGAPASLITSNLDARATKLAEEIMSTHQSIDQQAQALEQQYRPEAEQLRVLHEAQQQHAAVTEVLRVETATAQKAQAALRRDLDGLLDGILEINAAHRTSART